MADCRDGGGKRGMAHRGKKNMGRSRFPWIATSVPSVLHCKVGEEVAATLRTSEIRLGGSFFV